MEFKALGRGNAQELINAIDRYIASHDITITTKQQRMKVVLICASHCGWKLTRFDAERFGDHCFNSTISEISRDVPVSRNATKRPTRYGKDTPCKEYWLEPDNAIKAEKNLSIRH